MEKDIDLATVIIAHIGFIIGVLFMIYLIGSLIK